MQDLQQTFEPLGEVVGSSDLLHIEAQLRVFSSQVFFFFGVLTQNSFRTGGSPENDWRKQESNLSH